jgi:hypothetical protein
MRSVNSSQRSRKVSATRTKGEFIPLAKYSRTLVSNLAFQVEITDAALRDVVGFVKYVRVVKLEPVSAERWYQGLVRELLSLETLP